MDKKASQGAAADTPQSAAHYVRRSSAAMRAGGARLSRTAAERQALLHWAEIRGKSLEVDFIERFSRVSQGAEHVVYHDAKNGLAIKATHPNRFGHSARNEGLAATPLEYLQRLGWHNALFGDDIRIIGVARSDDSIEIVTSQPWIVSDVNHPTANQNEIDEFFERLGFCRIEVNQGVPLYFSRQFGVLVADAHEGNILPTEEGTLAPIDVVIGVPDSQMLARILAAMPNVHQ